MYGQIIQNVTAAASPVPHTLRTANFCAFMTQDIAYPGSPVPRAAQRAYVSAKNPNNFVIEDPTIDGPCNLDVVLVSPHSLMDIGPIVGDTRTQSQLYNPSEMISGSLRRPSYRSLHTGVVIQCNAGQVAGSTVLTHLLGTTDIMVFIQPTVDPFDAGPPASVIRVYWTPVNDLNVVKLHARREDGQSFSTNISLTCDVMVMARRNVGHSIFYHSNPSVRATRPSYGMSFSNVSIPTGSGVTLQHGLNAPASTVLVGLKMLPTPPVPVTETPVLTSRDVGGVGMQVSLSVVGGTGSLTDADVLVMRPHSILCL